MKEHSSKSHLGEKHKAENKKKEKKNKQTNKQRFHRSAPWQTEKNETKTPHRDSAPINTCRGGFVIYSSVHFPLFISSLVKRSANQNLPVVHTHPYSYHRDWLSSGLSDWSELFTRLGSMPS